MQFVKTLLLSHGLATADSFYLGAPRESEPRQPTRIKGFSFESLLFLGLCLSGLGMSGMIYLNVKISK